MDALAREQILEHARQPRHYGRLPAPTVTAEVENPLCGDRVCLDLVLDGGQVAAVGFTGRGCALSQAGASLLSEAILAQPLPTVAALTPDDMLDLIGVPVGPARQRCAILAWEALRRALAQTEKTEG
jgi:nitrogen fixation NifU-like protein